MKPSLFMREEKGAIDAFAAFLNVTSMDATESNFNVLRKPVDRLEQKVMKEVRMKRMNGVSVGNHPFFQKRGSFDGEKMVVALRINFNSEGLQYYDAISKFIQSQGFQEKSMKIARELLAMAQELVVSKRKVARRDGEILRDISRKIQQNFPDAVEEHAEKVLGSAKRIDVEYDIEPAQQGGWSDPSWEAHVDVMYFDPNYVEWSKSWDEVSEALDFEEEMFELAEMGGVDVDLVKMFKTSVRSLKPIVLKNIEVKTGNFGMVTASRVTVKIKKVENRGITLRAELGPPNEYLEDEIMDSLKDWSP